MKCERCSHYYIVATNDGGHNPAPCCHLREDTGRKPDVLTQECFEHRKKKGEKR